MARAEAFAYKNTVARSVLDGAGVGFGFLLALLLISTIRELLGAGTFLGYPIYLDSAGRTVYQPMTVLVLAPGAFLVLGLLMATFRAIGHRRRRPRPAGEAAE